MLSVAIIKSCLFAWMGSPKWRTSNSMPTAVLSTSINRLIHSHSTSVKRMDLARSPEVKSCEGPLKTAPLKFIGKTQRHSETTASRRLLSSIPRRPARMLRRQDVSFGVRHQAQDASGKVAYAGDVCLRAVRVLREAVRRVAIRIDVFECNLAGLLEAVKDPSLRQTKLPSPCAIGMCIMCMPFRNGLRLLLTFT